MFGLTTLGIFHTAISLVAVGAGLIALLRDRQITLNNTIGKTYVILTAITALTGFGIFQHGGFGKPHVLGIMTLVVLAVAIVAGRTSFYGRASRYVETLACTTTLFFHMIPGITETATRLPLGAPLAAGPDAPLVQRTVGVALVLFLIVGTLQVRRLRAMQRGAMAPARPPSAS
ncbi:MAG TPA: hypothetical protein VJ011_00095 [Steroidobacteraceae bacterium]|nr:hypothetical protein [Steroidobacteraceae bacterium]